MNVYEAIRNRQSVRAYQSRSVPEDVLGRILEAARLAPSANNRQPWKFVVVTDKRIRVQLVEAARNQGFVGEAPVVIAAVGLDPERVMTCEVPCDPVDLAIALDHLSLAAVEEGLGTCWIGAFYQDKTKQILGVPGNFRIVALMTLGYPADEPRPKARKAMREIISRQRFD